MGTRHRTTRQDLAEKAARLEALTELSRLLMSTLDPSRVLEYVVASATRLLDASVAFLMAVEGEADELVRQAGVGMRHPDLRQKERFRRGEGLVGWVWEHQRPLRVTEIAEDPRMLNLAWVRAEGLRGFAGVPVKAGPHCIGVLCVMRVPPEGTAYRSIVPLVSGEIGSDVARYLLDSEQTPSAVGVGVYVESDGRVGAAGGFVLQAMPGADAATIELLERNVRAAAAPSDLVREGLGAAAILERLLDGLPTRILEERPVRYRCRCSRERVRGAIVAMGRAEILDVLASERRAEVVCEFCGTRYEVGETELRELLEGAGDAGRVRGSSEPGII